MRKALGPGDRVARALPALLMALSAPAPRLSILASREDSGAPSARSAPVPTPGASALVCARVSAAAQAEIPGAQWPGARGWGAAGSRCDRAGAWLWEASREHE